MNTSPPRKRERKPGYPCVDCGALIHEEHREHCTRRQVTDAAERMYRRYGLWPDLPSATKAGTDG